MTNDRRAGVVAARAWAAISRGLGRRPCGQRRGLLFDPPPGQRLGGRVGPPRAAGRPAAWTQATWASTCSGRRRRPPRTAAGSRSASTSSPDTAGPAIMITKATAPERGAASGAGSHPRCDRAGRSGPGRCRGGPSGTRHRRARRWSARRSRRSASGTARSAHAAVVGPQQAAYPARVRVSASSRNGLCP